MYLKNLSISKDGEIIREIPFHAGLNLIIDNTESSLTKKTGNNVGKTTVLRLIDYCLGGKAKKIYADPENPKLEYKFIKDFLTNNNILISLRLKSDLSNPESEELLIERNFLSRNKKIQRINGVNKTNDEFELGLTQRLFPSQVDKKPTYRQIISHNFRHEDISINYTLKTLDGFTSDAEYEALHLFMFGCDYCDGEEKRELLDKLKTETKFKKQLERDNSRSTYEASLSILDEEIRVLNDKKASFNINKEFERDLATLNEIKYGVTKIGTDLNLLKLRKELIIEAKKNLSDGLSNINNEQLKQIYSQVTDNIEGIHKTFEQLVQFHNGMIEQKIKYITKDLPRLDKLIFEKNAELKLARNKEALLSNSITRTDSFADLEELIGELNEKFRLKGEYEKTIQQITAVDKTITDTQASLSVIADGLFSDVFKKKIGSQRDAFNKFFSAISKELYDESYALRFDEHINSRSKQKVYKFDTFNANMSSGKKQGEISCFDIAYTLFADDENIPCMHFILNDKKELMHDNQLVKIANLVNQNGIQFIASMLRDKLPQELNNEDYFIVKLSQEDKLFRASS